MLRLLLGKLSVFTRLKVPWEQKLHFVLFLVNNNSL